MDLQIIAQSQVHSERRLLIGRGGRGYIQLDASSLPIEVPARDFARLRSMEHYRPLSQPSVALLEESYVNQVAD
jgi:hypothetical protein